MRQLFTFAVLSVFVIGIVGCSASGEIEGKDADSSRSYKRTEVKSTDGGTKTTKTEVKRESSY